MHDDLLTVAHRAGEPLRQRVRDRQLEREGLVRDELLMRGDRRRDVRGAAIDTVIRSETSKSASRRACWMMRTTSRATPSAASSADLGVQRDRRATLGLHDPTGARHLRDQDVVQAHLDLRTVDRQRVRPVRPDAVDQVPGATAAIAFATCWVRLPNRRPRVRKFALTCTSMTPALGDRAAGGPSRSTRRRCRPATPAGERCRPAAPRAPGSTADGSADCSPYARTAPPRPTPRAVATSADNSVLISVRVRCGPGRQVHRLGRLGTGRRTAPATPAR